MKKRIILIFACLASLGAHAEDLALPSNSSDNIESIKAIIPIYSQRIAFNLPTDWKVAFQDQNEQMFMIEFIPKNENIENWTNMVSVQGFKNFASQVSSKQFLDHLAAKFESTCTDALVYKNIDSPLIDGYQSSTAILGCADLPSAHHTGLKAGQSEIGYYYSIQGKKDIYLIHKSIRGNAFESEASPLTRENIASFINPFMPIELCNNNGAQTECNK